MRILDLFAGIGGFSLAAHWMEWETAAFVEWDKDCHRVLQKNFPNVPIYGDIKEFQYEQQRDRIGAIDLVCGGFPCQPFSAAGKRNGTDDDRYLWPEMLRTIREVRPRWVVGENVAGLITMDGGAVFNEICASLEAEGYSVEAFVIPACAVSAPHRRDRVWIVANARGNYQGGTPETVQGSSRKERIQQWEYVAELGKPSEVPGIAAHPEHQQRNGRMVRDGRGGEHSDSCCASADADGAGLENRESVGGNPCPERAASFGGFREEHWLQAATWLCRMDDGLPSWVDRHRTRRLKQLGNSIVPQVVYEIFRAIEEVECTCNSPEKDLEKSKV